MGRSWSLTDLEFLVLWEELGEESLPAPLFFTSRTAFWDAHLDNKARARSALRDRDPDLDYVLRAVHMPELRVEVHGWDGRDPRAPAAGIRMLGVRSGEAGYLVVQRPGETVRHSAGFTITEFWAAELATEVVAGLPDTAAGRGPDTVLAEPEDTAMVDYAFGLSPAHETLEGGVVDRAAEFLAAPAPSMGTIDVVQGRSRFGPRGVTRHHLEWRDLDADGRYVVTAEQPPVAVPADRRRMITTLESVIAEVVLAIADE
ncbi:ESX secretion-associated protein EspG [Nocardia sp. NPDC059240]|uniref:ESX secretion-associated protein EspG n=1 Tax=Nocardia sp. NPDC059240 TaxID=3346786 RepID=UPI003682EABB